MARNFPRIFFLGRETTHHVPHEHENRRYDRGQAAAGGALVVPPPAKEDRDDLVAGVGPTPDGEHGEELKMKIFLSIKVFARSFSQCDIKGSLQ